MDQQVPVLQISMRTTPDLDFTVDVPMGFDKVIGREPSAGITLADSAVSRRHARLYRDASGVWVQDVGSTNGTYVNGQRLVGSRRLNDGDAMTLGDSVARFQDVTTPTGEAPAVTVTTAIDGPPRDVQQSNATKCPACGVAGAPDRWFCDRCGEPLKPVPISTAPSVSHGAGAGLDGLITPGGSVRRGAFRRAMRAANGGRRVRFNEGLAFPTIAFRMVLAVSVLVVIVVLVALAEGAGPSTIGLGG